jgi:hypothetical protein
MASPPASSSTLFSSRNVASQHSYNTRSDAGVDADDEEDGDEDHDSFHIDSNSSPFSLKRVSSTRSGESGERVSRSSILSDSSRRRRHSERPQSSAPKPLISRGASTGALNPPSSSSNMRRASTNSLPRPSLIPLRSRLALLPTADSMSRRRSTLLERARAARPRVRLSNSSATSSTTGGVEASARAKLLASKLAGRQTPEIARLATALQGGRRHITMSSCCKMEHSC